MSRKSILGLGAALLVGWMNTAVALPVIYNDSISAGTAAFDATINAVGGNLVTDLLGGLSSGNSWDRGAYSIASTSGSWRGIDNSYLNGQAITINPASPVAGSGLTFTFDAPINAFGLEIGDWATCCLPSSLYISFDGGATRLVATANSAMDNPGYAAGEGYRNFVAAIDDSASFTTVTFYGDGIGEALYAGGTIRYALVDEGSVSEVPEPATLTLLGAGLAGLGFARRRKQ